jgi:hypothetical protein
MVAMIVYVTFDNRQRLKAEGRRQKAEGRRQKAEGRRQKAECKRQNAECRNSLVYVSILEETEFKIPEYWEGKNLHILMNAGMRRMGVGVVRYCSSCNLIGVAIIKNPR